jgi:hypothetical protein
METQKANQVRQEEWTLDADQMIFMLQRHNEIEAAYANEDMTALRELSELEEYLMLFGDMSFDEAYDRYESTLEHGES